MKQPLVSQPPYGEGKPMAPVAVSELPGGGPSDRGLPLDSGIPGASTFNKPEDDVRRPSAGDEPIQRIDGPDDIGKSRDRIDTNEDSADSNTSYYGLGEPEPPTKTEYPYRDGVPNAHNAAFIAEIWKLEGAPIRILKASAPLQVVAATRDQILTGLDAKFQQRARKCSAVLKRADVRNLRWIFSVDCGNGPKAVKIKANRKGKTVHFGKLDLELSCSCPAWQWLGPEYHAKRETYMLGPQVGTASAPDIRDPERDNRVCKHVAAALALTRRWEIPAAKAVKAVNKALRGKRSVRKALRKQACNVCAAEYALSPENQEHGWRRTWETSEGPRVVYVRAKGDPEGSGEYQFRKEGQKLGPSSG